MAGLCALRAPQWAAAPLIRQCCNALLGSFKVWNAATVGGNMCASRQIALAPLSGAVPL